MKKRIIHPCWLLYSLGVASLALAILIYSGEVGGMLVLVGVALLIAAGIKALIHAANNDCDY